MKKKVLFIIGSVILGIVLLIGLIIGFSRISQTTQKERQIEFLKEHEEEMISFIKTYSSEDEDVTFHWDTTKVSADVPFSTPVLLIRFDITNSSKPVYNGHRYSLTVRANLKKLEKIEELTLLNAEFYYKDTSEMNE